MTTFQYVHGYRLPPAVVFRRNMSARMGSEPQIKSVVRNFPPAFVLTWTRAMNGRRTPGRVPRHLTQHGHLSRISAATSAPFVASVSAGAGIVSTRSSAARQRPANKSA